MEKMVCSECGRRYGPEDLKWRCSCGGIFDLEFGSKFSRKNLPGRGYTLWCYREVLPLYEGFKLDVFMCSTRYVFIGKS